MDSLDGLLRAGRLEECVDLILQGMHAPSWETQFTFAKPRKWASDFAWPARKLLVEVEGATYTNGRHTRGSGYEKDVRKYNAAELLGYHVLKITKSMIQSGEALDLLQQALEL